MTLVVSAVFSCRPEVENPRTTVILTPEEVSVVISAALCPYPCEWRRIKKSLEAKAVGSVGVASILKIIGGGHVDPVSMAAPGPASDG
jgi:hypothetical protein